MTNEEISPIKKNSGNKPLSYNEASLKQLLKRTLESSPGGYPNKILERRTSAKKKDVPTFFFNLPDTRVITEKGLITDITDNPSYDFSNKNDQSLSILYSNEKRYNGYNEPKVHDRNLNNRSPFKQQYSLLKITSMELTPINNDENTCVQYSQPDEVKTTVGNVTEPNDPMIRLNTNPSKMTLNVEKPPKRPLGNKKRQNSCSFPKKPPTHNNTSNLKPNAKVQKPKEQPLSRKNSTQFFQNKNFSFEMTYFKPIDESKLDEYIHSVNVSRGVISPLKGSTPENSPLKKRASESRERKVTENKLNYSQDILSHHRGSLTSNNRSLLGNQHKNSVGGHNKSSVISHSNKESVLAKPKEEEKKIEKSPQKKITTKSSDQKVKVVNVKVNQGNNPGSRLNTVPSKSNISISKNKSKVPSTNQQPQSEQNPETCSNSTTTSTSTKKPIKKSGDSSRSRSSSKTKTSISQKAKKVVIETEDGNTYSKLDRLLQDLKTNITRTTKEDESCTNTGTPSEVGLFNQSLNSEQHKEQESSGPIFPQKSLKKTLIAALEKQ